MIKKAMSILQCIKNDLKNYSGNVIMAEPEVMDTILSGIGYTISITSSKIPQRLQQSREEKLEV